MIDNTNNNVSGSLLPYMVFAGAAVCVLRQLAQCVSNCVFGPEDDGDNHLVAGPIDITDLVDQIEKEQHKRWEIEQTERDRAAAQFIHEPYHE